MTLRTEPPYVFVSYAHDDSVHQNRVTDFIRDLRASGIDAHFDRDVHGTPPEGWPLWMQRQIEAADFVLLLCTETYNRRHEQREVPDEGNGAKWEGVIIRQDLYEAGGTNKKFAAVLFEKADQKYIPKPLKPHTYYLYPSNRSDKASAHIRAIW